MPPTIFNSIHPNQRILLPLNIRNQQEATWREREEERVGCKQTTLSYLLFNIFTHNFVQLTKSSSPGKQSLTLAEERVEVDLKKRLKLRFPP